MGQVVGVMVVMPHPVWKEQSADQLWALEISTYRALDTACHRGTDRLSDWLNSHSWTTALQLNIICFMLVRILRIAFMVTILWIKGETDYPTNSCQHKYCKESGIRL